MSRDSLTYPISKVAVVRPADRAAAGPASARYSRYKRERSAKYNSRGSNPPRRLAIYVTIPRQTRILAAFVVPAVATLCLTGCAAAATSCVVRHGYAIVIFQNGMANPGNRVVTHFRLNVTYRPGDVVRRFISAQIRLKAANGGNPPVVVRLYPVGSAAGCRVDKVAAHR
jgi:hypothetical protein